MPKYRVEGTGGRQEVVEACDPREAVERYLHYPGADLTPYTESTDPNGIYGKGEKVWSHLTISVSPPFEECAFEGCDAGDDYEEFDDGLCYEHQPDLEEEDEDDDE